MSMKVSHTRRFEHLTQSKAHLIKQQETGFGENSSGNCHSLLLAPTEPYTPLPHGRVVALGKLGYEVMTICSFGSLFNLRTQNATCFNMKYIATWARMG